MGRIIEEPVCLKAAPGSPEVKLRRYDLSAEDKIQSRVRSHYFAQHQKQTVAFVKQMHDKWLKFDHFQAPVLETLDRLSAFLDESDPDVEENNRVHAYQTAERMRAAHPDKPELHLVGLIHDMGKIMSIMGEHQWAVTGDTYPVGCLPARSVVYGIASFGGNEDLKNPLYNTELGMYEKECGIDNLLMNWSHDEYLYQVLKNHKGCKLSEDGLFAIRFHSFYPYHTNREYLQFESAEDRRRLPAILELNACDLYSKVDSPPDITGLVSYYQKLVDEYIPGLVNW